MTELPVHTLQIPNPFSEGRNRVYVIGSDPATLIDSGVATRRGYDALVAQLGQYGLSLRDVGRVILTHKHIDHIGNAWRIQRESGAEILIHDSEMQAVRDVDPVGEKFRELVQERLREWQVPHAAIPQSLVSYGPQWEIETAKPTGLVDGQRIHLACGELEAIHAPGHTMGSVCLRYGRYLFSGDHVLPDISPNIGGGDMRHSGVLAHYLRSLRRTMDIAGDIDQVFPGHGEPFDHLEQRCQELLDHHHQRLQQIEELLQRESPQSVYQIACRLFGEMRDFHVVLGCAEANAHLEFLLDDGRVVCEREEYRAV